MLDLDAPGFVDAVERACRERGLRLTPIRAKVLGLIAAVKSAASDAARSTALAKENSTNSPFSSSIACWACSNVGASGTVNWRTSKTPYIPVAGS